MKKILLTAFVFVGFGLAASAQEKAKVAKPKQNLALTEKATKLKASKSDSKDEMAERIAAKQAYLQQNKGVNSTSTPAKAALTRD